MRRRDLSKALVLASTTGSAVLPQGTDAQTCAAPCFPRTPAEIAARITPANLEYPDGNVLRYGADPTGAADSTAAFNLATFAGWDALTAPYGYREVVVPAGWFKINGTVYVRSGTVIHGTGMGTYIDCSHSAGKQASFRLGWNNIEGKPHKDTGVLTGGYPPELYGMFFNGGAASFAVVELNFPGGLVHDCWFAAPGIAVSLNGGYLYDCEIDGGLNGVYIGSATNQTVDNVRFFNQNFCINFNIGATDISDCIITGCTFEYAKFIAVSAGGGGGGSLRGVKFQGCDFIHNIGYETFTNDISVGVPNAQMEFNHCSFHNASGHAALIQAPGAVIDFNGCIFDGLRTNASPGDTGYKQSRTAAGVQLNQGTLRMTDCQFRNLSGCGVSYGGSSANVLEMNGVLYSGCSGPAIVNISNSNAQSTFYANSVKGDAATPFVNAQSTVPIEVKNAARWFGAIKHSGASHYVLVPYQQSSIYRVTLTANPSSRGSQSYRKSRCDYVEKDNDFEGSAQSFLTQTTVVEGAGNRNGKLSLNVAFGTVGGGTSIPSSDSGVLAISWPDAYSCESIDVQLITSG